MRCALTNTSRSIRTTWRMLTFLLVAVACGDSFIRGAVAASDLKYAHHSPLASALSGRSVHDSGGTGISIRAGETNAENTDSSNGAGGNGVVGEVLVPKTFPLSAQEPTCEQLRAMWIFSKRQSRAAEITNEIPTYRDPFAYNVWEPYYSSTRSMGSVRMVPRFGERTRSPVYGRVVSREPLLPQRMNIGQRHRHLGGGVSDLSQTPFYGAESKPPSSGSNGRRTSQYRYVGANGSTNTVNSGSSNSPAVQGSFQKLKELIWTERAKELTQQRRAEEMAARAAVLKEIANGQNIQALYKPLLKTESHLMDENRTPDRDSYDHMNDDHRSVSIASGQSQAAKYNPKSQNNSNLKSIGTPRSYSSKAQKSTSIFSGNGGGRGSASRSMMVSSYMPDDVGIPKAYPMRPSHFRERNRSLFKQHSPGDYFLRENRQAGSNSMQEAETENDPVINNMVFERLVNELNRRIIEKQNREGRSQFDDEVMQDDDALLSNYDYEPQIITTGQYGEPQELFADYLN